MDYLKLYRDSGVERSCGFVDSYADLEPNNLRIEFRSNNKYVQLKFNSTSENKVLYYAPFVFFNGSLRFPGFKLRIVCFNPDLQDTQGCSPQQRRLVCGHNAMTVFLVTITCTKSAGLTHCYMYTIIEASKTNQKYRDQHARITAFCKLPVKSTTVCSKWQ